MPLPEKIPCPNEGCPFEAALVPGDQEDQYKTTCDRPQRPHVCEFSEDYLLEKGLI